MTRSPPNSLRMLATSSLSDESWFRSAFMIDNFGNSTCSDEEEDEDDSGDNEGLGKDDDDDDDACGDKASDEGALLYVAM